MPPESERHVAQEKVPIVTSRIAPPPFPLMPASTIQLDDGGEVIEYDIAAGAIGDRDLPYAFWQTMRTNDVMQEVALESAFDAGPQVGQESEDHSAVP
ncbi:hypothetical protein [Tessaracoccus caeni]|uniref:hypothetical protein n=1 Tax=Tessaracoccus caeni TaxID=3031239 RepID=UPI0023D989E7|nr:hypothetical protein [Tessaracoccus caeni]MDF1487017.1 hypothetical protein [Tessaracoccus caeni]